MRFPLSHFVIALVGMLATFSAYAQQPRNQKDPHVGYIYPAGGKRGSMFEATIGGQFLEGTSAARLTGDGLQVTIEKYTRPLSNKEFNELRDKLMEAWKKSATEGEMMGKEMINVDGLIKRNLLATLAKEIGLSDDKIAALVDYRAKLMDSKRQLNPQLAESVLVKIYVPPEAAPGVRELRLVTPTGLSNPLRFVVGELPETMKGESDAKTITSIAELPVTINGQLLPGRVDRYSFVGHQGQQIVARAEVRRLIPYLADAVPGWFQAALTLHDAKGREIAHAENFRFDPDPVLTCEIPEDGTYTLEVRDALYRGREDFVYRVTIGELPFVTGIFPLGVREGEKTAVKANGLNLRELTIEKWGQIPNAQPVAFTAGAWTSNAVAFAVGSLPESVEKEPNNDVTTAQRVTLPFVINGQINTARDTDLFCFEGREGDRIVAEVQARRLGSPLDSVLVLTDTLGKQLAVNDDTTDKGDGLSTHHADSLVLATLPAGGFYYVRVGDTQGKGGPDFAYRLRLSRQQPDFAVRIVPSCINVRAGSIVPITAYVLRQDGFDGAVDLALKDGPPGAALEGARIPPGQECVRFTLTVPPTCTRGSYVLTVEGQALLRAETVRHSAVPADDMMQAFSYRHLVPAGEQILTVTDAGKYTPPLKLAQMAPVKLHRNEPNRVRFSAVNSNAPLDQLMLELNDPPAGLTLEEVTKDRGGVTAVLKIDSIKLKDDLKANLLFNVIIERTPPPAAGKPPGTKQRVFAGLLPAIPFEVGN